MVEVTEPVTVGAVVSILSVLLFCSELPPLTAGRVRVAGLAAVSLIVPPARASEAVLT